MKKYILLGLISLMLLLNFLSSIAFASEKNILIDPGHGGIDGGATSVEGKLEKDLNLSIGLKLREVLESSGYTIYMTRDEDKGLYTEGKTVKEKKREDLANRVKMKESSKADIFVSLHQNTFPEEKYKGLQVWYAPNSTDSKILADLIQKKFTENIDTNNKRVPKDAGTQFRVIRRDNGAASVIVECGFISNKEEGSLLGTDEYQYKLVNTIKDAIDEFYSAKEN